MVLHKHFDIFIFFINGKRLISLYHIKNIRFTIQVIILESAVFWRNDEDLIPNPHIGDKSYN